MNFCVGSQLCSAMPLQNSTSWSSTCYSIWEPLRVRLSRRLQFPWSIRRPLSASFTTCLYCKAGCYHIASSQLLNKPVVVGLESAIILCKLYGPRNSLIFIVMCELKSGCRTRNGNFRVQISRVYVVYLLLLRPVVIRNGCVPMHSLVFHSICKCEASLCS